MKISSLNKKNLKMKVLIADDSIVCQTLLEIYLKKLPFTIEMFKANNGQEALDLIEKKLIKFDLIFIDIIMPIIDGYELAKMYKGDAVLVLTTANDINDINISEKKLFHYFLRKPINLEMIENLIKEKFSQKALF